MNRPDRIMGISSARTLLLLALFLLSATGARADEVTFELSIERGQVPAKMRVIRVMQRDAVRLRWRSDRPITLHLHGYDIETKVEPSAIAEMSFTARATGRFSIEEHKPKAGGGHSHGDPLVRVEVHPR